MNISTYKDNTVSNYHDGYLRGMLSIDDKLELIISSNKEDCKSIILDGLIDVKAKNFFTGNIILDLEVFSGNVSDPDFFSLISKHYKEIGYDMPISSRDENLYLLSIQSSYGCDLCALAREISILDIEDRSSISFNR